MLHKLFFINYFANNLVVGECTLRRVYKMRRALFLCILKAAKTSDPYFVQKCDGCLIFKKKLHPCVCLHMVQLQRKLKNTLTWQSARILRLWNDGARQCIATLRGEYLCSPTKLKILHQMDIRTLQWECLNMFGSINCMRWRWKACPVALQWSYKDKDKNILIILEAVCDQSLYIWHALLACQVPTTILMWWGFENRI